VAESAVKDPLGKKDPRQACADALYESVYGSKAAARNKTLTDLETSGDATKKAQQNYEKLKADKNATKKAIGGCVKSMAKGLCRWTKDNEGLYEPSRRSRCVGNCREHAEALVRLGACGRLWQRWLLCCCLS